MRRHATEEETYSSNPKVKGKNRGEKRNKPPPRSVRRHIPHLQKKKKENAIETWKGIGVRPGGRRTPIGGILALFQNAEVRTGVSGMKIKMLKFPLDYILFAETQDEASATDNQPMQANLLSIFLCLFTPLSHGEEIRPTTNKGRHE